MRQQTKLFSEVILLTLSFIFIIIGILLLLFTEWVSLLALKGMEKEIANIVQQFLGSSFILIGILCYAIKGIKGKPLYLTISGLLIFSCINLYLLFLFSSLIILPSIYFIFQILIQLMLIFSLYDAIKRD